MSDWTTKTEKVVGWVGPQLKGDGVTRCVHLYPELPTGGVGKWRCCTVYEEHFELLPNTIVDGLAKGSIIHGSAPESPAAKTSGIFNPCTPFVIEIWLDEEGKDTKKLAKVLGSPEENPSYGPSARPQASAASVASGEPLEFREIEPLDTQVLMGKIAEETRLKMAIVLEKFLQVGPKAAYTDKHGIADPTIVKAIIEAMWRDAVIQYRDVRPTLLAPASGSVQPDGDVITHGKRANFLHDIASQHPGITDAEQARGFLVILGVDKSGETESVRLVQAQRIWLYATLLSSPFSLESHLAAIAASEAYPSSDEIPF